MPEGRREEGSACAPRSRRRRASLRYRRQCLCAGSTAAISRSIPADRLRVETEANTSKCERAIRLHHLNGSIGQGNAEISIDVEMSRLFQSSRNRLLEEWDRGRLTTETEDRMQAGDFGDREWGRSRKWRRTPPSRLDGVEARRDRGECGRGRHVQVPFEEWQSHRPRNNGIKITETQQNDRFLVNVS